MQTNANTQRDLDTLTALDRDYLASVEKGDVKRFEEILADDFMSSNPDGSLLDKAEFLKLTAKPVTISGLAAGIGVGVAVTFAADQDHQKVVKVTQLSQRDIIEKLDGKAPSATVVEVTFEPGQEDSPHHHAATRTRLLAVILHSRNTCPFTVDLMV